MQQKRASSLHTKLFCIILRSCENEYVMHIRTCFYE